MWYFSERPDPVVIISNITYLIRLFLDVYKTNSTIVSVHQMFTVDYIYINNIRKSKMSHDIRFPTVCIWRPAKALISLHICTVGSEPVLVA